MTVPASARPFRLRWWAVAGAVALLAAAAWLAVRFLSAPGRQRPSRDLNVILVTIDTLRADHVGAYGAGLARTPALDALAAEGTMFGHCVAQVPLTLPSHTSLLSSTYPTFNQVRDNGGFQAPAELTLLSEVLREQSMATAAFIGAFVLQRKWGLDQGWDLYSDRFDPARYGRILLENEKRADEVLADARRWLEGTGGRRFFAWIHLYDPHSPYDAPAPYAADTTRGAYRGEVEYTDAELGKFIAFLKEKGLYERTLIVVAADHGEGLGDHDEDSHGMFLYETTVHVPLIVRAPRPFAVRTVAKTVELVDVAPTVLDLLGVAAPRQWQGKSLWPLLDGGPAGAPGQAYSETFYPRFHYGWSSLQSFSRGGLKYILAPRDELYDLKSDPGELRELAPSGRGGAAADPRRRGLRGRLLDFAGRSARGALRSAAGNRLSPEDRRRLAALGYLSGEVRVDESRPLADPKDRIGVYKALIQATNLFEAMRIDEAAEILERVAREEPELADAWSLLGNVNLKRKRRQEALAAFRRALALKPDNNFLMINVVKTLVGSGEVEAAAEECLSFLKVFPDDAALLEQLGHIRLMQRRPDEALPLLRRATELDPAAPQSVNLTGEALILKKDYAAADDVLRRGLAANPRARNTHYLLAQVQEALGRPAAAADLYRAELEINDKHFQSAVNLGNLLKQSGRADEAARFYRQAIAANPGLKLPRFHLAEILLRQGGRLDEAADLCLQGIAMPPRDRDTLFGYFVLTNLYNALGNPERRDFYTREGEKLIASLEKK
jgi:arylsulfatase A-like enzyme/predicted Zn-dependent protease